MSDPKAHFKHLLKWLKVEREEDRRQYQEKIRNKSIADRRKDGVTWYPLTLTKSAQGVGGRWVITLERTNDQGRRHLFQAGSSAALFCEDGVEVRSSSGVISRVVEDQIQIMLHHSEPPEWLDEGKLGIDLLFDESTYDEMERAIESLLEVNDGRLSEFIKIFLGGQIPRFGTGHDITYPGLNSSQSEAVRSILTAKDLALVHGPPGTGKTTTIVQAISEAVQREKQVLVCAPSNSAVDLIVEKLHQRQVNVVRLGHPARVTEHVVSHTLDAQLLAHSQAKSLKNLRKKSEELHRLAGQYKRKFGKAEADQRRALRQEAKYLKSEYRRLEQHMIGEILDKASVITCTLTGANSQFLKKRQFKTVFLDESSQALEPAAWIPIMKADRVVMAGDHLQLAPTVKSIDAVKAGLGHTIFERCMNQYSIDVMLKVQYRMHQDIMSFSNQKFYRNKLECADVIESRPQLFEQAAGFIDTAGCGYQEEMNPETLSTYNKEEAAFVIARFVQLLESEPEGCTYGIIAPYKAQIEELKKSLRSQEWKKEVLDRVTVNTVDAFQGQERDVILISLTRSNDRGEIGFLAEEKRLNVAMTRARHQLTLVGDSATLSTNKFFDDLINYYQQNEWYQSAFEYLY